MTIYDVFNGDADGICSLLQLRLQNPKESTLVTGVKRNINLLRGLSIEKGDELTILDVSLLKNRLELDNALAVGANVFYADHHQAGDIPEHPNLSVHINPSAEMCTGLIINEYLENKHLLWALTAAFGDNLIDRANNLGNDHAIQPKQLDLLKKLGTYINYNGYGSSLEDLFFHPAELYKILLAYTSPLDFIADNNPAFITLEEGYTSDLEQASNSTPIQHSATTAAFILPNQRWARRVSGVFGNDLANKHANRAHAVLTEQTNNDNKGYLVSIRAPLTNKINADTLASQFPTGGGRKGAAGINFLPEEKLTEFLQCLEAQYKT